jgi:hypothetical protein
MSNKFEQLLDLLINEENDKAEALFHEIVVEKSRDIYEGLAETAEETTESKEEEKVEETAKEEATSEEKVEETEEKEVEEGEEVEIEETSKEEATNEEESIEEVGGDATDELIADVSAEEEGDAEGEEHGDEEGEAEGDTEERVADLEDALDELKAEFEKMMSGKDGEEEKEESLEVPAEEPVADELQPMEAVEETKETVKEYKTPKSADNADHADNKKSPVANKGGKEPKADAKNIAQGSAEDKGRPAPTAKSMNATTEPKTKDVKANTADGSDKSAKSTISGK